jgi:hypothetical protein
MPVVRLKPHNPQKGHKIKTFTDGEGGHRYESGSFYTVTDAMAQRLTWVMQDGQFLDPKVQVYGKERSFDIFPDMAAARRAAAEEERNALLPGSASTQDVLPAAGRDAPSGIEGPPDGRTLGPVPGAGSGVVLSSAVEPADDATFFDRPAGPPSGGKGPGDRPPTALERRKAATRVAAARTTGSRAG